MEICPLDNGNYYIRFSKEEVTESKLRELLSDLPRRDSAYFEVFGSDAGALVFARACDCKPVSFTFTDVEQVIAASQRCPEHTLAYLAHANGKYVLIVYPWNNDEPPLGLYDFSSPTDVHPDIARHYAEHGRLLLGPEAVRSIRAVFGLNMADN